MFKLASLKSTFNRVARDTEKMKRGYLSEYFIGVAAKTLAATEVDPNTSRGHEYQGVDAFREFLGSPETKKKIDVTYIRLEDDELPLRLELDGTWYNSRKNQPIGSLSIDYIIRRLPKKSFGRRALATRCFSASQNLVHCLR